MVVVVNSRPTTKSNKVMLEIKVIDNGIGICEQDRANLFKPYFRSSNSNQMNF